MDDFPDAITVDGRTLPLRVARKSVRNLNARLRDGTMHVSAPLRAPRAWIDRSLPALARSLLLRERRRTVNEDGLALEVARRVAARFEEPHPVERVEFEAGRTSVWGTWHGATRTVRLAAVLRHMPPAVLEGVVAHELCHARWRTHGPRFQALLRRIDPRADWAKGFLDGAAWFAREGGRIPATDRGPLAAPAPAPAPEYSGPAPPVREGGPEPGFLFP